MNRPETFKPLATMADPVDAPPWNASEGDWANYLASLIPGSEREFRLFDGTRQEWPGPGMPWPLTREQENHEKSRPVKLLDPTWTAAKQQIPGVTVTS